MTELDRALHASVLKREAAKEKAYREERERHEKEVQLGFGATEMTTAELKKLIDSDRRMYYRTVELNDKLYIHYKGWRRIQNLEGWTGLKALYAECNAFDRIEGLQNCRNLRSLFLQENCIRRMEGLENCPELWNLNLSNNFIERLEGLQHLKKLNTLTIAKNRIGANGVDDIVDLLNANVSTLDLQDNKIWDPDVLPEVFMRMKDLRVLYLKGNPCSKKIPNYRKSITVYCADLKYLDDRPVFPDDRRAAEAFNRGGLEEERAERRRIREESNAKHEQNMKAFNDMIEAARAEKRERMAMASEDPCDPVPSASPPAYQPSSPEAEAPPEPAARPQTTARPESAERPEYAERPETSERRENGARLEAAAQLESVAPADAAAQPALAPALDRHVELQPARQESPPEEKTQELTWYGKFAQKVSILAQDSEANIVEPDAPVLHASNCELDEMD